MSIVQKSIHRCDNCHDDIMGEPLITMRGIPYEGTSSITMGRNTFEVGNLDYCCLDCMFKHLEAVLTKPVKPRAKK